MTLRTACIIAFTAVPALLSGPAASNAPSALSAGRSGAACFAPAASEVCRMPRTTGMMRIAQTPRQQCIKICHDTYNDGEPLKNCIRQCPPPS